MTIKAILFDMDGVLIEAKEWHYEALNKALGLFGIFISRFDHIKKFDGLSTRSKLEILTLERGLPHKLHEFINEMKQLYTMDILLTQCKRSFVHEFALLSLKSMGYKLAVCSNSVRNSVKVMMEKSGLDKYFDFMLSNNDVSSSKPDPEIYIKAMKRFDLLPEECLIIEDNKNGIEAALASGGHLLIVKEVADTNLENILSTVKEIESKP